MCRVKLLQETFFVLTTIWTIRFQAKMNTLDVIIENRFSLELLLTVSTFILSLSMGIFYVAVDIFKHSVADLTF